LQETEALTGVIDELAAAIRQHRAPITDGAAGVRVVRILEAVSRSIECNGCAVSLREEASDLMSDADGSLADESTAGYELDLTLA
jgi:hypothetical protein